MAEFQVEVIWRLEGAELGGNRYSRRHCWRFDGGAEVSASSSPHVVPVPMSDAAAVDPEEAFVASLSSCHMLWFLSIAARGGFVVDSYRDKALGRLGKDASGKMAIIAVTLHPDARFTGATRPTMDQLVALHDEAHERCFIANSVRTEVRCEPIMADAGVKA